MNGIVKVTKSSIDQSIVVDRTSAAKLDLSAQLFPDMDEPAPHAAGNIPPSGANFQDVAIGALGGRPAVPIIP
jgi:hypothetical protein